jgi:hypothetical protein
MNHASVYDNIPCKNCGHGKATHRDQRTLNGSKYRCAHRNDGSMPRLVWVPANAEPMYSDRFRNGHYQFDCDCTAYSPSRQPTTE